MADTAKVLDMINNARQMVTDAVEKVSEPEDPTALWATSVTWKVSQVRLPAPMRLRDLIRQIRAARTAADERAVINKVSHKAAAV